MRWSCLWSAAKLSIVSSQATQNGFTLCFSFCKRDFHHNGNFRTHEVALSLASSAGSPGSNSKEPINQAWCHVPAVKAAGSGGEGHHWLDTLGAWGQKSRGQNHFQRVPYGLCKAIYKRLAEEQPAHSKQSELSITVQSTQPVCTHSCLLWRTNEAYLTPTVPSGKPGSALFLPSLIRTPSWLGGGSVHLYHHQKPIF